MLTVRPEYHLDCEAFRAVVRSVDHVLLTTLDLAQHTGLDAGYLAMRRGKKAAGYPYIKLPTGGVRYRLSDIVVAELRGSAGPLSLESVSLAIASCPDVPDDMKAKVAAHVRKAIVPTKRTIE